MVNKKSQYWIIVTVAIIVCILSIIHVLTLQASTPRGNFFTGVGHYYLDFFYYLQFIASGMHGNWLPYSSIGTDDTFIYFRLFPYVLIGHVARVLHISAAVAYWGSVVILIFILVILIWSIVNKLLKDQPFYLKICTLLITIFSSPFYIVDKVGSSFFLKPYEFWYGPGVFVKRFDLVPHNLLMDVVSLISILIVAKVIYEIKNHQIGWKKMAVAIGFIDLIFATILVVSPVKILTPLASVAFISFILLIKFFTQKNWNKIVHLLIFLSCIIFFVIPLGLIIREYYKGWSAFAEATSIESQWIDRQPLTFLLLNIGPITLFFPFALKRLFKNISILSSLLVSCMILSYIFYATSISQLFGTHNLRFFSIINYIVFAYLGIIGMRTISSYFKIYEKLFILFFTFILMLFFSFFNLYTIYLRVMQSDARIPMTKLTYLPQDLKESFKILSFDPSNKAVLTEPYNYMGMLIPIYTNKKTYLGRKSATIEFDTKASLTNAFFNGTMENRQAQAFVNSNKIGFIFLSSIDFGNYESIKKYSFLKEIYRNKDSLIFKVI